ncbi:TonB-dependent siderophore receptor [Hydrogenophaga sp. 5NK40-0174]|uniref:TonB-dependent siderophore receptor n=1 Tax=Hydrogenophaga sp. 5NK40-0174 TaxID=3127649 RepID=UPI0031092269
MSNVVLAKSGRSVASPVAFSLASPVVAAALMVVHLGFGSAAWAQSSDAQAPVDGSAEELPAVVIKTKRENRVSKGATNLPIEVKDTPQSISTIDKDTLRNFGASDSNDALRHGTGLTVDEWETNRTSYSARGFDIMLTQIDGLGMTNDWGIAEGQLDTYLFDKVELIRGANGLLTGVGNASGTINYVRKRPTNTDGGEALVTLGSYGQKRVALDYNKVLTEDGRWAGRMVLAQEDKDSHLRALSNKRTAFSGIVEGQVGDNGILALGMTYQDAKQRSPMWGSLTLPYADGTLAEFDVSASTSQDWTRWDNETTTAFVEYTHALSSDWEAKVTYNHAETKSATRLFYAYTATGYLNNDNTGLLGWPYRSEGSSSSDIVDANLSGQFQAWGRKHEALVGLSHSRQESLTESYAGATFPVMPAFPYGGDVYPEPAWGEKSVSADGEQSITRLYTAGRLQITDQLKGIAGINAIRLVRDGTAIYGGGTNLDNETTQKVSPYVGLTYDLTPHALAYASYSDIYQAQDQRDIHGAFLKPMKGVNTEVGVKAEWLGGKLLTTVAFFNAEQKGLATVAGFDAVAQQSYYEPKDVTTRGFEIEATGHVSEDTKITAGFTSMKLTGPDGGDIYEWIPRRTVKLLAETRVPVMPKLRVGSGVRWQSGISKLAGARQSAYTVADAYAAYELSDQATVRLNVNNVFDKKYIRSVTYGAIYGAPRTASVTLEYKF